MKGQIKKSEYYVHPSLEGLEVLDANLCKSNFPFHTHDTLNITLVIRNTFLTKLQGKLLRAPVGTISITNSNEVHATPCDQNLGNSFITFYIPTEIVENLNNGNRVFFQDRVIYDRNLFQDLLYLVRNQNLQKDEFNSMFYSRLKFIIKNYSTVIPNKDSDIKLFQSFINETSLEDFSLELTAGHFGMNKYKFIRLFKQETGLTPNNFVLLKRIEHSKDLLKNGASIIHASLNCGFYDKSHFYKNFKRFTGVNPLDFQNAFQRT